MEFPHGAMVTIRSTVTTRDKYGNTTTTPTDREWGPCAIAPRSTTEGTDNQSPGVIVGLTVLGPPPPVPIDADDELVIATGTYAGTWLVQGMPGDYQNPFTGWNPGVEVAVQRAGSSGSM